MVLHIGYGYLILIVIGLKPMLAIFWIVYLEVKLQKMLRKKIFALLLSKEPVIKVVINLMQQQGNGVDCGVFAVAYATSLAFGENPSLCSYNVPLIRQHLVNCLEKEMMYPFPKLDSTKRVLKCKKIKLLLSIYCSCRSVCQYEREDPMVECMRCCKWFHQKFEKIPHKVFANKAANFFCKGCC